MKLSFLSPSSLATLFLGLAPLSLSADEANLAKELANPVSSLISVPLQNNLDFGIGPGEGHRYTLNLQPVMPFEINEDWNLISRTIFPLVETEGTQADGSGDAFGLGDTVQSFFLSPENSSLIWGAGAAFLLPTATDEILGGDRWGAGPTAVVLKQEGPWSVGMLANHLWDLGGDHSRDEVNATFVQPFVNYITENKTTYALNVEATYDWHGEEWTMPVNMMVSQLFTIGDQPVQVFGGFRYYLDAPQGGPEWGLRFGITFLFPAN
ncbi:transporter [Roseibacillus ishigakijimensis]|uniref:Transporter n=1 Tax=Roseibacillus ishigakijimensis TaxID=454146 RepID=A0A934VLK3_9BACT|nr:transporter [Roseibacillus ishigakijimensis]MBK1833327.1 transporter [Roseibacillus ishigakijimensis]